MAIKYMDDDENIKTMRETAREVGLTKLLLDIAASPLMMGSDDIDRLGQALTLLGVDDDDWDEAERRADGH